MSSSNQDSGIFGAVLAIGLLIAAGGGFFLMQRTRAIQSAALAAEQRALAEQQRAQMVEQAVAARASNSVAAGVTQVPSRSHNNAVDSGDTATVQTDIVSKLMNQQADWNKGNLDAFMKVYWNSEQLTFASGGKVTRGYQATLDGYKAKYSTKEKLGKLTFDDLEFQRLADQVMLVLGTWHLERGDDSVGGNFSLVWQKVGDQWLIIHDHTSALPSKKE